MSEVEYVYYSDEKLEFPLSDEIVVANLSTKDDYDSIISNSKDVKTQVVAPEIDFYINFSEDDLNTKINSVKTLYDARMVSFDLAKYFDYEQDIGNLLLLVSKEKPTVFDKLKEAGLKCILLNPEQIAYIEGHVGELKVGVNLRDDDISEVKTDQIVWFDAPEYALLQSGVYDFKDLSDDEIVEKITSRLGVYKYKNYISYDSNICQYHERRVETCGKCAEVCPTVAIVKEDESKHLVFSHIDCESCGGCISVCPSGALDYTQMPREAFYEIAKLYKDKVALIIPRKMEKYLTAMKIKLPKDVLPFAIEGEKYLHEAHLLTLLQESGAKIVFFTDFVSRGTKDAISMLNQIFQAKFKKDAISVAEDEKELEGALKDIYFFDGLTYDINEEDLRKREVFSVRLSHLVGEDDLGVITTGPNVHYGMVKVDASKCTLCLSCVGACNVEALSAFEEDFSLKVDNSICTTCKYCEVSCPENCIEVVRDEVELNPTWFGYHTVAKDEMFKCVMCGVPFATKKSVEKIANMMKPLFAGDEVKIKTLYCCADCKPKVMFEAHVLNEQNKMDKYDKN